MREPYALRRFLSTKLDFNEDVLAWGRGTLERDSERLKGVLVATDRRIAFYGESWLRGSIAFQEIPVRTMTRVEVGDADSSVEVACPQRVIRFFVQRRTEFEYVRSALEELQSEGARSNGAGTANGASGHEAAGTAEPADEERFGDEASGMPADAPAHGGLPRPDENVSLESLLPVEFGGITYIRGLRGLVQPTEGRFVVGPEHVEFHVGEGAPERIAIADITAVEVTPDTRLLPAGEKNRTAFLRLAAMQPPAVGGPLPLGARTRVDTITIWYLSISFRSGTESGVALFSVSSWASPEKKASEIVELVKRNGDLARTTSPATGVAGVATAAGASEEEPRVADGAERAGASEIRERLVQLKELFESELISETEYAEKRKELLARF